MSTPLETAIVDMVAGAGRAIPIRTIYKKIQPRASSGAAYSDITAIVGGLVECGKLTREMRGSIAYYGASMSEPTTIIKPRAKVQEQPSPEASDDAAIVLRGLRTLLKTLDRSDQWRQQAMQERQEREAAEALAAEADERRIAAERERDAIRAERDQLQAQLAKLAEALRGIGVKP